MFTSTILTITGTRFQINQSTVTLFSGHGPKSHSLLMAKSQNAIGYRVKNTT